MIIRKKVFTDIPFTLDDPVYQKESRKPIADDFYAPYDPDISEIDFITARSNPTVGIELTEAKINTYTRNVKCNNHYVSVRVYEPSNPDDKTIFFIHGGGFITGRVQDKDVQCHYLADKGNCRVVAVEYRLAPEAPYPGGLNDCLAALQWTVNNLKGIITLMGDSAGANLVVACCLKNTVHVDHAFLLYGAFDLNTAEDTEYNWSYDLYPMAESQKKVIMNRLLRFRNLAVDMKKAYVMEGTDINDEFVSPICSDRLEVLPPLTMIEAEYDYYLPCNQAFCEKLKKAGVPYEEVFYEGMDHGFMDRLGIVPQAADCLDVIAEKVKSL